MGPEYLVLSETVDLIDHATTQADLTHLKTRERPIYHAISYAAGNLKNKVHFKCDGRIFFIGFNLWQALVQVADLGLPCPIWVDAICINQRDIKEKNRQIQQMAEVYKQAQRVWIWLGEAHQYTLPAMKQMPRLVKILSGNDGSRDFQREYDHYFDASDMPKTKLMVWEGISDLVNRPYFGRLWVLQEAVLAKRKTFLCGPHTLRWDDFQQLIQHLQRQHLGSFISSITPAPEIDAFDFFLDFDECNPSSLSSYRNLLHLRDTLMARPCSGSRDKVIAVLGLLSAGQQMQVKADARVPKLYANFTSLVLMCDITLTTFILAGSHRGLDALPSWCPDYDVARKVVPLSTISCRPQKKVPMTTKISPTVKAPRNYWFQVEVSGYHVDKINSVARGAWPRRVFTNDILDSDEARQALDWEADCSGLVKQRHSRWTLEYRRVYARTLLGDARVFKEPPKPHIREFFGISVKPTAEESSTDPAVHYEYLRPALEEMENPGKDGDGRKRTPPGAKRFLADVSRMCDGRAFFSTKQRRIGLGPSGLRRNDIICFLRHATVPFHSTAEPGFHETRASTCISSSRRSVC